MLSVLSTNTVLCPWHRKHGARHWEYRWVLPSWSWQSSEFLFGSLRAGCSLWNQSAAKVTIITVRSSAFSLLPSLRSSSFLTPVLVVEWLVAVPYCSTGVLAITWGSEACFPCPLTFDIDQSDDHKCAVSRGLNIACVVGLGSCTSAFIMR